ncbi:hypothetical protein [Collimonas humicola]|uniref:hypothetical protein n=1 Tax=Collimonas humicola TaxID=2825886 RepID=UPI001B8BCDDD|nr:hypothetical protein [Collimonas humicola]
MADKKIVTFIKAWKVYSPDDVAGFDETTADALIDGKVAVEFSDPSKSKDVKAQKDQK